MDIRKAIQRRIRLKAENVDVTGDVNAAVAANVGERGKVTRVTSRQGGESPVRKKEGEEGRGEREA